MTKKITIVFILTGSLLFTACLKSTDIFVPDLMASPDTTWVNRITPTMPVSALQKDLELTAVKDSFDISSYSPTIKTIKGLQCTFSPNSCITGSGQPVTGKVTAEYMLLNTRGDMIRMNKPTESNGYLLISGGEFFMSLKSGGQEVQLAPNTTVTLNYPDNAPSSLMNFFWGDENDPDRINWVPSSDMVVAGTQAYDIKASHLRWNNLSYIHDTLNTKYTVISAPLPRNYTNTNTLVFLAFNNMLSVIRLHADVSKKIFITHKIPIGKTATILAISKQGNDYFFGKKPVATGSTIIPGNTIEEVPLTPVKTSLADIKIFLANL
jgi:hypothetical protein